jgi:hypothetical protein
MTDALNIINSKIGDFFAKLQNNSGLHVTNYTKSNIGTLFYKPFLNEYIKIMKNIYCKLGFRHSIICNGIKCIIYQRRLGVLIDEETPIF